MKNSAASFRSTKAAVRQSKTEGRGLFAQVPIVAGEVVSVRGGHIVDRKTESEMVKPEGYWGYPISDEFVLAPLNSEEVEDVMMFLNHSCNPNIGILGQVLFVAMRDIDAGEELNIDYAMFGAYEKPMQCRCGSVDCRKLIANSDWEVPHLQERYRGYFSAYIQWKIDALTIQQANT